MEGLMLITNPAQLLNDLAVEMIFLQILLILVIIAIGLFCYFNKFIWWSWNEKRRKRFSEELNRWGIVVTPEETAAIQEEMRLSWRGIILLSTLATAAILTLFLLMAIVVSFVETGTLQGIAAVDSTTVMFQYWLAAAVGFIVGFMVSIPWLKRQKRYRITYGDIQPRRLSDYRSPWFFWSTIVFAACIAGLTWLDLPFLHNSLYLGFGLGYHTVGVVWIVPVIMFLVVLSIELFLAKMVTTSRLAMNTDPDKCKRLDDMMRSQFIGNIEFFTVTSLAYLNIIQLNILIPDSQGPYKGLLYLAFLVSLGIIAFFPLIATLSKGRLGGTYNGWPWNPRVTQ